MLYSQLMEGKSKAVGTRETIKALGKNLVEVVFIAKDAEKHITFPVIDICVEKYIPIIEVDTMSELGKACSVKVLTAVASCLKEK